MKAADKLSAHIKCLEELKAGNGEFRAAAEQTRAAIQASVEAAIQKYNDQIAQTEQDSGKLARQAYVAKMMGQKNLDQQLAAGQEA